jgi:ABC-2 type transport system permease protein
VAELAVGGPLGAYRRLLLAQIRSQASYRTSFAIDLIGNSVTIGVDLLSLLVLFRITPALGGFSVREAILIFTLGYSSFNLADLAVGNIERIRFYVRTGLLDAILVRPLGALPQLLVVDFGLRRVGRAALGLALLPVALNLVHIDWTPARAALVVLTPLAGMVFFSAIFVASSTVAFWWIESGELAASVTYGGRDFTTYPITVYSGWFRRLFAYTLGFGFVAYYPALALLGRPDPLGLPAWLGWASPLVAGVAAGLAAVAWRVAIRHYRSTGS